MELTNEQRRYLGLELIDPAWERMEIPNNCLKPELSTGKDILFFEGDILRKVIWLRFRRLRLQKGSIKRTGRAISSALSMTGEITSTVGFCLTSESS